MMSYIVIVLQFKSGVQMKMMKQFLSLVLLVALTLVVSVGASAADVSIGDDSYDRLELNYYELNSEPLAGPINYASNSRFIGTSCDTRIRHAVSGNQGTLHSSISLSTSNSFNSNFAISARSVTAAVGFSASYSTTKTASTSVPTNGRYTEIRTYDKFSNYVYDVMRGGRKIGTGTAREHIGFCFTTIRR